ncbi:MAG: leucine-rich repeat domain-containing protein, partial [Clostridia bacterium]|nr:leucine-rich repeat domain-containing protein [Clostridia bacterium]
APTDVVKTSADGLIYTFIGWDKDFDFIKADTDVNAVFESHTQTFKVTYVNWDGTILYTGEVDSQQQSVYPYDVPTRDPNAKFEYVFNGWLVENDINREEEPSEEEYLKCEKKLGCVTESFAVYAQFTAQIRKYTVKFVYGHDKELTIENVEYGSSLVGKEPEDTFKSSTDQYDFTFIGWIGYYGYVESDLIIEAKYAETVRKYEVKFVNDGEVVRAQEVAYGSYPSAPTVTPIAANEQYNYTFLGWGIVENEEGQFVASADDFQPVDVNAIQVKGEITYTAVYLRKVQQYVVTFYNEKVLGNRVEVDKIIVEYGTNATTLAPTVTRDWTQVYEYTFSGWSKDLTFVKSDLEVDAQYDKELRTYVVTYYNGDEVHYTEEVKYGYGVANKPANPTKASTLEFDFEFVEWRGGDENNILDDTDLYAYYYENKRQYQVTFFDLSVYELISTTMLYYGDKIERTIERDGYYFDAWYRDPDCTTMFNMETDTVDGIMMLFGNTVITGIEYKVETSGLINKTTYGSITGYSGSLTNVILPKVIGGLKMTKIASGAFENNDLIESIYIPSCYTSVESCVFKGIEEIDIYTQAVNGAGLDYPYGWSPYWNSNSGAVPGVGATKRLVSNNVENVVTSGDFRYILVNGKAVIDKFVNNNTTRAYLEEKLEYKKPSFVYETVVDEKTDTPMKVYTINYETKEYNITTISPSAFSGCENLKSVFIPNTITAVKKYAFSGTSVNLYIQREAPAVGSVPSGWALSWNSNRSGDSGTRTIYWGVVGMDQVGDFTYIFKGDGTAIAAEYNGSKSLPGGKMTIPDTVSYRSASDSSVTEEYIVTELGDELFADGMNSLISFSSITLPKNLKKIGSKVFYMNMSLSSITLPDTLEEIGDYAFVGTMALKEIFIPASIKHVGTFCFAGSSATIYLGCAEPKTLVSTPTRGLYWNIKLELKDIQKLTNLSDFVGLVFSPSYLPTYWNVAAKYTDVATNSGTVTTNKTNFEYILFNDGTATLIGYSSANMIHVTEYSIPEAITYGDVTYTVTAIGSGAFSNNTSLNTINIPASVTSIASDAFSGCRSDLVINNASAVVIDFGEAE